MSVARPILPGGMSALSVIWSFAMLLLIIGVVVGLVSYLIRGHRLLNHQKAILHAAGVGLAGDQSGASADELAKLADLRDRGALADAEFETQKKRLLGE